MARYFIEVAYRGTNYSGSQKQLNANAIQSEIEKALKIFFKQTFDLTGASRTDAGVHAVQNFFHFDTEDSLEALAGRGNIKGFIYRLNAILPGDISLNNLLSVKDTAHCRFDAIEREYKYYIYQKKNPFLKDRAYFFPYKLQLSDLTDVAEIICSQQNFASFSKRSSQVNNFLCSIYKSYWEDENGTLIYTVSGNRFLRGMVRGLVATMLKVGRQSININDFKNILNASDQTLADFSAPPQGLFLNFIKYPENIFL